MDTEQKAVGNQKVFIQLRQVLALQDRLRGKERELEQYATEMYTSPSQSIRNRAEGIVKQTILQIEAINGVVEALALPIPTESGHRTLNRIRALHPTTPVTVTA